MNTSRLIVFLATAFLFTTSCLDDASNSRANARNLRYASTDSKGLNDASDARDTFEDNALVADTEGDSDGSSQDDVIKDGSESTTKTPHSEKSDGNPNEDNIINDTTLETNVVATTAENETVPPHNPSTSTQENNVATTESSVVANTNEPIAIIDDRHRKANQSEIDAVVEHGALQIPTSIKEIGMRAIVYQIISGASSDGSYPTPRLVPSACIHYLNYEKRPKDLNESLLKNWSFVVFPRSDQIEKQPEFDHQAFQKCLDDQWQQQGISTLTELKGLYNEHYGERAVNFYIKLLHGAINYTGKNTRMFYCKDGDENAYFSFDAHCGGNAIYDPWGNLLCLSTGDTCTLSALPHGLISTGSKVLTWSIADMLLAKAARDKSIHSASPQYIFEPAIDSGLATVTEPTPTIAHVGLKTGITVPDVKDHLRAFLKISFPRSKKMMTPIIIPETCIRFLDFTAAFSTTLHLYPKEHVQAKQPFFDYQAFQTCLDTQLKKAGINTLTQLKTVVETKYPDDTLYYSVSLLQGPVNSAGNGTQFYNCQPPDGRKRYFAFNPNCGVHIINDIWNKLKCYATGSDCTNTEQLVKSYKSFSKVWNLDEF